MTEDQNQSTEGRRHVRRVIGHVSGWQEQLNTCVCGKPWPCPEAIDYKAEYLKLSGVYTRSGLEAFITQHWPDLTLVDAKASPQYRGKPVTAELAAELTAQCSEVSPQANGGYTALCWCNGIGETVARQGSTALEAVLAVHARVNALNGE